MVKENKEEKEKIKYYSFGYLIKINGGIKLFSLKRDKLLYLSLVISALSGILYYCHKINYNVTINFMNVSTVSSIALFGLIIATFAIISSINTEELIIKLIESGYYAYAIFIFTWASILSAISAIIGAISIVFSLQYLLFPFEVFFLVYAISASFDSIFYGPLHLLFRQLSSGIYRNG